MKLVEVVAVEDRSRAEGGHAVIVLRGVERAPANVTFDLTAVVAEDDEDAERPAPGLTGLHALEVTMTADGMALAIGPDIAECALFVPGAAVEITLPEVGVRGEFPWPAVTPLARPKRRNIMIKRNSADPLLRRMPASAPVDAAQLDTPASTIPTQPATTSTSSAGQPDASEDMPPQSSIRRPMVLSSTLPRRAIPDGSNDPASQTRAVPRSEAEPDKLQVPAPAHGGTARALEPAAPLSLREIDDAPARAPTVVEAARPGPLQHLSGADETVVATNRSAASEPLLPASQPQTSEPRLSRRASRSMSTGSAVALAAATLVAGQVIALRALNLSVVPRHAATTATNEPVVAAPAPAPVPLAARPPAAVKSELARPLPAETQPLPQRSVFEVIAAAPRSPRGVAAAGVTPARALQLAHGLLHGPEAERDAEEAAYWLKHYLAGATGGDPIRIALTQLGSAYAQPVRGERDFASARIVWELSSALGDPVAMCFLGAMHEHGLGMPQAGAIAATWYQRAAALGRTCAGSGQGAGGDRR